MDYTSEENDSEPETSSTPLNSTTEFELEDYFSEMATVYLPPTNNEPTSSETQPMTTVTQPKKRGRRLGSTNKQERHQKITSTHPTQYRQLIIKLD